jgi:hypothetical protein
MAVRNGEKSEEVMGVVEDDVLVIERDYRKLKGAEMIKIEKNFCLTFKFKFFTVFYLQIIMHLLCTILSERVFSQCS